MDSIKASGPKFGQILPAIDWIVWRSADSRSREILTSSDYLSGTSESCSLSFSRSSSPVVLQYFNMARLGYAGYRNAALLAHSRAMRFWALLESTGWFANCQAIEKTKLSTPSTPMTLPMVAFQFSEWSKTQNPQLSEERLSDYLLQKGVSVPCTCSEPFSYTRVC